MMGRRGCFHGIRNRRTIVLSGLPLLILGGGCRKSAAPTPSTKPSQRSAASGSTPSVADESFDFKRHPRKSAIKPVDVSTLSETERKYGRAPQFDPSVEYQSGIILMTQGDKTWASFGDPAVKSPPKIVREAFGPNKGQAIIEQVVNATGGFFTSEVVEFRPDLSYFPPK